MLGVREVMVVLNQDANEPQNREIPSHVFKSSMPQMTKEAILIPRINTSASLSVLSNLRSAISDSFHKRNILLEQLKMLPFAVSQWV